jgi:hypothetical protein
MALAIALVFSAGGPGRAAAAVEGSAPISPGEGQRIEAGNPTAEAVGPAECRSGPLPSGQALCHEHSTPRGVERRHSKFGTFLVPKAGLPESQLPGRPAGLGARRPTFSQPPLQVLFCTWLV